MFQHFISDDLDLAKQTSELQVSYLAAAAAKLSRGQNVRQCTETMEQHSDELDDQNQAKEEDENQTDRFQLQIFFANQHLDVNIFLFKHVSMIIKMFH